MNGWMPNLGMDPVPGSQLFTTQDTAGQLAAPGTVVDIKLFDQWASFAYVQAQATLAAGQCVTQQLDRDNADVDAAAAITTQNMTALGDFVADEFSKGIGGLVIIDAAGGLKFGAHYIQRNSVNVLFTDRVWGEALTVSSDYITHALNAVVLANAGSLNTVNVAGVAIGVITSGNYGWVQISGTHWKVRSVGTTDALVKGEGVQASSTNGACKGWTAGGTTAEDIWFSFGTALAPDVEADTAGEGVPIKLTGCKKFWE